MNQSETPARSSTRRVEDQPPDAAPDAVSSASEGFPMGKKKHRCSMFAEALAILHLVFVGHPPIHFVSAKENCKCVSSTKTGGFSVPTSVCCMVVLL